MKLDSGSLRHRVLIQEPAVDSAFDGAGSEAWTTVADVWADVQDVLPSRGERLADGLNIATRPARVRIRYRDDIKANMRVLVGSYIRNDADELEWRTARTAQIVTVPAELGFRDGLEFMVEDYSTAGNGV